MAFVNCLVSGTASGSRAFASHCPRRGVEDAAQPWELSRREILVAGFGIGSFLLPKPAQADRTGKFSTKLTAARRYLPRIAAFRDSLKDLKPDVDSANWAAILEFTEKDGPADSVKNPLELFASSFFSEGNKASSNTELKSVINEILESCKQMRKAAQKKNEESLKVAFNTCVENLNIYIGEVRSIKALGNDLDLLEF